MPRPEAKPLKLRVEAVKLYTNVLRTCRACAREWMRRKRANG